MQGLKSIHLVQEPEPQQPELHLIRAKQGSPNFCINKLAPSVGPNTKLCQEAQNDENWIDFVASATRSWKEGAVEAFQSATNSWNNTSPKGNQWTQQTKTPISNLLLVQQPRLKVQLPLLREQPLLLREQPRQKRQSPMKGKYHQASLPS